MRLAGFLYLNEKHDEPKYFVLCRVCCGTDVRAGLQSCCGTDCRAGQPNVLPDSIGIHRTAKRRQYDNLPSGGAATGCSTGTARSGISSATDSGTRNSPESDAGKRNPDAKHFSFGSCRRLYRAALDLWRFEASPCGQQCGFSASHRFEQPGDRAGQLHYHCERRS